MDTTPVTRFYNDLLPKLIPLLEPPTFLADGEEFIVVLPESNIHQASTVAERLRTNLSTTEVATETDSLIKFTASIGMTLVEGKYALVDDVIKAADKALYVAKNQGRNRVVIL
ncbi:MAG: GGDEF domain-containing protein [Desulfoplanes sp.]